MSSSKQDNPVQRFGEKLYALRTKRGLTHKQLANILGFSAQGYMSELENGKKIPTVPVVVRLARYFGVTIDQLLMDELEVIDSNDPKNKM